MWQAALSRWPASISCRPFQLSRKLRPQPALWHRPALPHQLLLKPSAPASCGRPATKVCCSRLCRVEQGTARQRWCSLAIDTCTLHLPRPHPSPPHPLGAAPLPWLRASRRARLSQRACRLLHSGNCLCCYRLPPPPRVQASRWCTSRTACTTACCASTTAPAGAAPRGAGLPCHLQRV